VSESGPSGRPTQALHPDDRHDEHAHSAVPYLAVWVALIIFTAITYFTGKAHLGTWALPLALTIACTKSALVALIFMHLKDSSGTTRLVFATSLVFVALLLFFTVADVATRFKPATPAGAPFGTERSQPEGLLEHELPE
jgi:cytochrome c oxidase subunit 4